MTLKGFKSFPHRTRLEFSPGVSVVVGPNGSGKSNVTEAVLWALGEQSPLAVRGQTMKDVIFAGGHGLSSSSSAEVEVVIDNADGSLPVDFSEISIVRKLDRDGEGEYRLNGARCRLVDVVEVLSDSGLGKEMHSVVSQGKVETIVHSRPRDRRLMIEEAAGLGKHRKRRRRAQLKLERTEENLSRALDVEREARSRLRPLKRQAEAAELHERLERQSLEARLELAARALARGARCSWPRPSRAPAPHSRSARRPSGCWRAWPRGGRRPRRPSPRSAASARRCRPGCTRPGRPTERDRAAPGAGGRPGASRPRRRRAPPRRRWSTPSRRWPPTTAEASWPSGMAALESELAGLEEGRAERLRAAAGRAGGEPGRGAGRARAPGRRQRRAPRRPGGSGGARPMPRAARAREAEAGVESARAAAARVGSDLAAVNQFLRAAGPRTDGPTLAEGLRRAAGPRGGAGRRAGPAAVGRGGGQTWPPGQRVLDRGR